MTVRIPLRRAAALAAVVRGGIVALALSGAAHAQVYDFNRFLAGGGGGSVPERQRVVTTAGNYVCLGVAPGVEPNSVRFMVWSRVPQPTSRVVAVAFDMGRYKNMFRGVSVLVASPGVKGKVVPAQPHAFLKGMNPAYWVEVAQRGHLNPEGLSPGRMIVLSAALNGGVTINDVIQALHEGLSPTAGASGLRIGVIVNYLAGGPPPGVDTINDDGGFVTAGPATYCS